MNRFTPVVIALIAFPLSLFTQRFTTNVRVNDDAAGKAKRAPVIRIDDQRTLYVSWIDFRNNSGGDIAFSVSTDKGATFSKPRFVSSGGAVNSNFQRTAYFAVDRLRRLHFVWMESKVNSQPDIWYSRSTDGGSTFSPPISVSDDSSKWAQDFPSIAVDATNNVSICFLDSREVQQGRSTNVQLYFTKSTDGGVTFSKPVRASNMTGGIGGTCECCRTSIAVSPSGNVYLAFRSNINNRRDIFIARSLDGGKSFGTAILAASEQWIIDACPVTGPSIALDSDETAHIVWRDNRTTAPRSRIYYTTLRAGASACALDRVISDSPRQTDYPTISIDGKTILVVYQDKRNDANDVYFTSSIDGGTSFFPCARLSDDQTTTMQEFPDCVIDDAGNRYAVWQDARRDEGDIYFSKDTTRVLSSLVEQQHATPAFFLSQNFPNPCDDRTTIEITTDQHSATDVANAVSLRVLDLLGREMYSPLVVPIELNTQRITIPTQQLRNGSYIIELHVEGNVLSRLMTVAR